MKPERPIRRLRNTDSRRSRNRALWHGVPPQYLDRPPRHRASVQLPGDPQRLTQSAGAGAELAIRHRTPTLSHHVQSLDGLQCAKKDRARKPFALADQVGTPVHPIRQVDVPDSRGSKQRLVAGVPPVQISMGGRVVIAKVGFRLHDPAGGVGRRPARPRPCQAGRRQRSLPAA